MCPYERAAAREERGLVEQSQIVDAPSRGRDGGAAAPEEQLPLVGGEQAGGAPLQLLARRQQVADQGGGGDGRPQRVEKGPELLGRRQLALEPGLVGSEATRGAERGPRLADQTRPQGQPPRFVGTGPGDDGGHEVVDPFPAQSRPGEAHPEADVLLQRPAPPGEGPTQELAHAGVAFDPTNRHRLLGPHLGLGGDVGDRRLDDRLLAERGQDLGDVAQEGPARAEDEDALPAQLRVVVEQEGGPVQADGGLAGARAPLHGQELSSGARMISSCSAWMVATMSSISPVRARSSSASRASPPRSRVPAARPRRAEEVVGHGHDGAAVDHDLAAPGQSPGRPWRWPGRRARRPGPASR